MEDPVNQLANYKLQLGQVEAALTGDPENAELLSLKKDLDEIIGITEELIDDTKKKVNLLTKATQAQSGIWSNKYCYGCRALFIRLSNLAT